MMISLVSWSKDLADIKPIGLNTNVGLSILESFQANSGFNYQIGIRDINDLVIVEGIAEGTACTFLCGIQVRDKKTGKEICSIPVEHNTHYDRQYIVDKLQNKLCDIIIMSAQKEGDVVNEGDIKQFVNKILDECYFSESRKSALEWAKRVGVIK